MDRSEIQARWRQLMNEIRAKTAHLTDEEIEVNFDEAIREVRAEKRQPWTEVDRAAAARVLAAVEGDREELVRRRDELERECERHSDRSLTLKEQGLLELAARENAAYAKKKAEHAQIMGQLYLLSRRRDLGSECGSHTCEVCGGD